MYHLEDNKSSHQFLHAKFKKGVSLGPLLPSNFRLQCEFARVQSCENEIENCKKLKCEHATAKGKDAKANAKTSAISYFGFCSVELSHSPFFFFLGRYNLMQVLARGLPNALRRYWYGCTRQCGGHRANYESSLISYRVFWYIILAVLAKLNYYVLHIKYNACHYAVVQYHGLNKETYDWG